ncbi:DsrE family protein [Levilactobacillus tongjiangensis]|uniref:DsrE family protein n=1 Tax=Levilactobacillus tongjiangensis TaxID=2486023 RepID=A0ABW1STE2_9LACO|nr:DsrE family protein [Levilactobacillus tongjiangensis]
MQLGVIVKTNDPEQVWNALKFSVTALKKGHVTRLLLMGAAVEITTIGNARYDISDELTAFSAAGGALFICETGPRIHRFNHQVPYPLISMPDSVDLIEWADKVVTF